MGLNDVVVVQKSGGLGRREAPIDKVCGLIFNGVAVASTFDLDKAYRLTHISDLDALGIDQDYDTDNTVLVYENIKDFFRINPTGELWIYGVDNTGTYAEMVEHVTSHLVIASEGRVVMTGYSYNDELDSVPATPVDLDAVIGNAETEAAQLTADHYPISTFVEMVGFYPSLSIDDYRSKNSRRVTPVVAQNYAIAQETNFEKRCAIGLALGTASIANVHENLGWVQKFNVLGGSLLKASIGGVKINDLSLSTLNELDEKGLLFLRNHTNITGLYWNDAPTCIEVTDDFAYLENNRTIDKATRIIRTTFLPHLNSPIYVDPESGNLSPNVVGMLESLGNKAITDQMLTLGEVSGFDFSIDPEQNILATSKLQAVLTIVPVGTARKIIVNIGFDNPF